MFKILILLSIAVTVVLSGYNDISDLCPQNKCGNQCNGGDTVECIKCKVAHCSGRERRDIVKRSLDDILGECVDNKCPVACLKEGDDCINCYEKNCAHLANK